MATTPTFSLRTVEAGAFFDEFLKIAQAAPPEKKPVLQKWVKNTLIAGAGYGLGHGAGMLIDKGLELALKDKWQQIAPPTRKLFVGPALGIATAGAMLAHMHLANQRYEADRE